MSVSTVIDDGVAMVTLHRPERLNAWSPELGNRLTQALRELGDDAGVRVVVIRGEGRGFCAGADLSADAMVETDLGDLLRDSYAPGILALRELPQPAIAAVNGPAVGIGCALALACDLVVAARSAYFLLPFTRLGLTPDSAAGVLVASQAGRLRAAEMALLCERVGAEQAHAWGLANRVVPDVELDATVAALAQRLAAGAPLAFAATKRALHSWELAQLERHLEYEAVLQSPLGRSEDFREGLAAFSERREPVFHGR